MKNKFAVGLGKLGGLKKSPRKAKASRLNGKKGGRPKKEIGEEFIRSKSIIKSKEKLLNICQKKTKIAIT